MYSSGMSWPSGMAITEDGQILKLSQKWVRKMTPAYYESIFNDPSLKRKKMKCEIKKFQQDCPVKYKEKFGDLSSSEASHWTVFLNKWVGLSLSRKSDIQKQEWKMGALTKVRNNKAEILKMTTDGSDGDDGMDRQARDKLLKKFMKHKKINKFLAELILLDAIKSD